MFFELLELIFIIWILRNYYLWKNGIKNRSNGSFNIGKTYKASRRNEEKETIDYQRIKEIMIETGKIQHDILRELLNGRTESIAKLRKFYGKDLYEEPTEWIKEFNRTAEANNWTNGRRITIAATHLREIAMEWYEQDKENIQRWDKQGYNNSFEERFIERFATTTRKHKWIEELQEIKQKKEETVNTYEIRFRTLARKVQNDITEIGKIMFFKKGLLPEIYSLTVLGERNMLENGKRNTLENVIDSAKRAEISLNCVKRDMVKTKIIDRNGENTKRGKRKRKSRCYNCGKKGHIFTECKKQNRR